MKRSDIELIMDRDGCIMFKTTCSCSTPDHEITVCVEKLHKDDPLPFATLFFQCGRFDGDGWFGRRLWNRLKDAAKLVFKGELRIEEEFIFRDAGHVKSFRDALAGALEQAEKAEEEGKAGMS